MGKEYGFGIIGTGMIGGFHAGAIEILDNARLVAACDVVEERVNSFAREHGCKAYTTVADLMADDDVDVVTIGTPSGSHMDPAIAAAEAGKHAIVEKPLEITLDRIDRVIEAHEKAGTRLGGVFNSRFTDAGQLFKAAADAGRFGTRTFGVAHCPWWRTQEYYDSGGWRGTMAVDGGGSYMNQGIHTVDMLQWVMGEIEEVFAYTTCLAHTGIDVEDTGTAALKFKNGALGSINCTTSMWPGHFRMVEVAGDKGSVVMGDYNFMFWQFAEESEEDDRIRRDHVEFPTSSVGASDPSTGMTGELHAKNFAEFLTALDEGTKPLVDGAEARKSVAIILAIYESAKTGKPVTVR